MAADKNRRKKQTNEKPIRDELLDELLAGYEKPEDVIGERRVKAPDKTGAGAGDERGPRISLILQDLPAES